MRRLLLAVAVLVPMGACGADAEAVRPFEREAQRPSTSAIDSLVLPALQAHGIKPANLCSDEVFVRRVYLDVIGTLPQPQEVRQFLRQRRPNKRTALINSLMDREEFADYWAMKWCDLLRVKAEFPINLWPNGVQAYYRWIRDAVRDNMPYDQFVRELLTSSGSNFRVAPVNFYRAVQGQKPETIASAVALTFMGTRSANWTEAQRANMAAFFSRIQFKGTAEWKEEIISLDPAPAGPLDAVLPDGTPVHILPDEDPRRVFADWLIAPGNPWFTRNIVNRVWAWLLGRGLIHEPDDIRPDNPAVYPEVLAYLQKELVAADYDLRHVYRLILNSRVYQQSSIPQSNHPGAEALFAQYAVRRLDAEVLVDALDTVFGGAENYESAIPEPFTFIPNQQRTIALADGSITSQFLEMFGRPSRDTGLESERNNQPTDAQRLHMLNSTHVQRKIEGGWRMRRILQAAETNRTEAIQTLYLSVLSRRATPSEMAVVEAYCEQDGLSGEQIASDLAWALVNTKEFLYRH
ncbi:MAG: DUF1553 domain-containing protein [Nitrospiraceae bacterium]|nr:DUF1553 domain-containing protein [Nitrospiraceae bacterium]